ncbi:MAG: tRNA lysidine(34) synthetase TilS [Syntrophomonadaceae bacterium]|nr:tRNA lysidine(34) synthetase TilS [Syntrophomonadaceae bacterium]
MLSRVKKFIVEHNLINRGELVIAAVSGGPDSVAMLHILNRLSPELGFSLYAAHLHHGLRAEADTEEEFVVQLTSAMDIPCSRTRVDVRQLARVRKLSVEEAGREARYTFFYQLQQELEAARVATGHHMGDQAETVLMRLLRGSGLKGLRGIMPRRGIFIRPLLECSREEIVSYLHDNHQEYCVDHSNYDPVYLRNRIRHQLLPQLQREYNPGIAHSLARMAAIIRDENQVLEDLTDQVWEEVARTETSKITLSLNRFHALVPGLQRRIILRALSQIGGVSGWGMRDVETIRELSYKPGSSKEVQLARGIRVGKSYEELIFHRGQEKPRPFSYLLQIPGKTYIKEMQAEIKCQVQEQWCLPSDADRGWACLDWDKLSRPLEVRSRRPGDRFYPLGLGGSKKLKDYFIDARVPASERDRVGLLACGEQIYWVIGHRLDARAAVEDGTRQVLVVEISYESSN